MIANLHLSTDRNTSRITLHCYNNQVSVYLRTIKYMTLRVFKYEQSGAVSLLDLFTYIPIYSMLLSILVALDALACSWTAGSTLQPIDSSHYLECG
jgi:hypothetical protein